MNRRRTVYSIIFFIILLVSIALVFTYLDRFSNDSTEDRSSNVTGDDSESPFKKLTEDAAPSDIDKLLSKRLEVVPCQFPDSMGESIGYGSIVPGIKEDASSQDDYWILHSLQPVVLGYETFNEINYFIGGLKDESGVCKKIVFVLNGNFNVDAGSDSTDSTQIDVSGEKLSFEAFVDRFPIGSQVKIYFLGQRPPASILVDELCNYKPPLSQRYCTIQRISELYSYTVIDQKFMVGIFDYPSDTEQVYVVTTAEVVL